VVGYLIRNMCLLSTCYVEWLCKDGCCKYQFTGKGTKAQILLRFRSYADLISGNLETLVPSVLGQMERDITCLSFKMGSMSWLFFCSSVGSMCILLLDYSGVQKRCPKVS